ncbi:MULTISPECIES: hypothetical protein [Pedobacter]|uniref:Uncharacterized protein n=1 Tax=Pedobacter heparinus (strain ATCC 13125 / DSM 2366 / CIP 104194 / JCM 7457 / NBRC 12017 / NCIMB 9290 / NRRL B-14731 / HIM 762-3) TaxID=485917 RepID=C6Y1V4_PEDHD|nr:MULTISPECIES: hypothetical protein [Pedobacter]ACU05096.1 hypothetical protein Phep_2898 [Pedobacter heparinus DSM 2366]MBB5439384.1 hypothetical protein [Pedobacter sp. AK017]
MGTSFEISLNMKTLKGLETYASFYLGVDQQFAERIFGLMRGEREIMENSVISMDLTKRQDGIPYPISILHCNWEHLAYNTKIITKEVFKELNLEQNRSL